MPNNSLRPIQSDDSHIVLYQPDETLSLEVRIDSEHDTVWLTQQQIADLFGTKRPAITKHLSNIYQSGELDKQSTCSILEHMGNDGKQRYTTAYYNLDAIISVGYRVNSLNATAFRRWATSVLRDHLLRGYSINHHLIALQQNIDNRFAALEHKVEGQQQQVDFLVHIHRPDDHQIFPTGCIFDAWEHISALIRTATQQIILIDNYCDDRTLSILAKRTDGVTCTIHTRFTESFRLDLDKHNSQYAPIDYVQLPQKEHDRFLIIDQTVYILGDSIKDLGHSMTTVLKTNFTPEDVMSKLK